MKHTSGPWFYRPNHSNTHFAIRTPQMNEFEISLAIVSVHGYPFAGPRETNGYVEARQTAEANARMMAAAPEMFECLQRIWQATAGGSPIEISNAVAMSLPVMQKAGLR